MNMDANFAKKINQDTEMFPRDQLKEHAFQAIDDISEFRTRSLHRDTRAIEAVLFGGTREKDHPLLADKAENKDELRKIIGGMINGLTPQKVEEFAANPLPLIDAITGETYTPPEKKEEIGEKYFSAEPGEEAFLVLSKIAKDIWQKINWSQGVEPLLAIRTACRLKGIDATTQFFRGRENYIIISVLDKGIEKGIILPKPGTQLDMEMAFDLFLEKKVGRALAPRNVQAFPRVERRVKDYKSDEKFWRVVKNGTLTPLK
jgi:hypothetical protein